ncbi:CIA30 family protein [Lutibacter sp. TH_r2]|uniref:CIA30 family protein n=1 Tax=Lutibacter sp. TH_r2 TaxID=3082083 RepID=UPI002953653C|nr:CIA30 family protein [Lutibacter sp. TH_r2]MDV7187304.1 CIA30 family protein [Lutibacter sp. TH_r2]
MNTLTIFDFKKQSNTSDWKIVDDVVMGGKSNGSFYLDTNGNGVFEGNVSLENNGGFSSVKYQFEQLKVSKYKKIILRVKGDGKKYQLRFKPDKYHQFAYTTRFQTTKDWQSIEILFSELESTYRGRKLNYPNFPGQELEEIGFLFGNKKNENFKLLIDKIEIE